MNRNTRAKAVAAGMCPSCGARFPVPGKKSCEKCLERARRCNAERRLKFPDKVKTTLAIWRKENPDKVKALQDKFHAAHPNANRIYHQRSTAKVRDAVFGHYGEVCACCGASREFLTLDHIDGNGHEHRKAIGSSGGVAFYRWIIRNGFPPGYQSLCWNCNCAKAMYGICPHLKGKQNGV